MLVHAKCLEFAWDSTACKAYNPNAGPLPGGLWEIDTESQLATLTTLRGEWRFQYPGHEGRVPKPEDKPVESVATATIKEIVEAKAENVKPDKRRKKMSAEHKAKMIAGRAASKAARMARLAEVAA